MARKPKTSPTPSQSTTSEDTVKLDSRAFRETEKGPVGADSALENTLIMEVGASGNTQEMAVIPAGSLDTTVILNPNASASTQEMAVNSEKYAETVPIPNMDTGEATVAIRAHLPEAPAAPADPRATRAINPGQLLKETLPGTASAGEITVGIPMLAPTAAAAPPAAPAEALPQPVEAVILPHRAEPVFTAIFAQEDAAPDPLSGGPAGRRGLWLAAGAALVFLALGIWYLVDRRATEGAGPEAAATPAAIPAPVPAGYQEVLRQAQAGDVAAMRNLGAVYTYGLGVPVHRQEGLRWYKKAAAAGSTVAAEEVKALESPPRP